MAMNTTEDLFKALLTIDADQTIEVACDEATKEAIRISLVKMLTRYRATCAAYMDADQLPQSLLCDWEKDASDSAGTGIAKFSIGKKRRRSRPVEFTIVSKQSAAGDDFTAFDPTNPANFRGSYE